MTTGGVGSGALRQAGVCRQPHSELQVQRQRGLWREKERWRSPLQASGWQGLGETALELCRRPGAEKGSDPSAELSSEVCRSHRVA